jgi:hypothetical protein
LGGVGVGDLNSITARLHDLHDLQDLQDLQDRKTARQIVSPFKSM